MAKDIISEVINKGVPIDTPITVRYSDLYTLCDNKEKFEEVVRGEFYKFAEYLKSLFPSQDINLFHTMSVFTDPNTLEKKLQFSKDGFFGSLIYNLNFNNSCDVSQSEVVFNDFNPDMLYERTKKLRKIKEEYKLQMYFPSLYLKYIEQKKMYEAVNKFYNKIAKSNMSTKERELEIVRFLDNLIAEGYVVTENVFEKAKKFSLKRFCNDYADCFDNMISHANEICEYLDTHTFSISDIELDKEKLELYIAYRFLTELKSEKKDDKQRYVYFIANYFKENSKRKTSTVPEINVGGTFQNNFAVNEKALEGININPKYIYSEFSKVFIENPEIKLVNFNGVDFSGMNEEEIEEFIRDYLSVFKVNWVIIPKEEIGKREGIHPYKPRTVDEERLNQLFMEKIEFYSELSPIMHIQGRDTFDGYEGFIFSNGMVILDKFFENSRTGKVSKGDAIYYMNIEDFYRLSRYPKSVLRKDPNVGFIEHRKRWQEKALKIINMDDNNIKTSEQLDELKAKTLVKKNNKI